MVRDFELIRKILLLAQEKPAGGRPYGIEFPGEYGQDDVNEHVELLIEAGLLKGEVLKGLGGVHGMMITGLTWSGHDFIQAAASPAVWRKSLAVVKEKGGAITFDLFKALLESIAKAALGL
jgi:hypothetical protein